MSASSNTVHAMAAKPIEAFACVFFATVFGGAGAVARDPTSNTIDKASSHPFGHPTFGSLLEFRSSVSSDFSASEFGNRFSRVFAPTPLYDVNVTYHPQNSSWQSATLLLDPATSTLRAAEGIDPSVGIAWAHFVDQLDATGWTELTVEVADTPRISNSMRMYGAGYIEGLLTAPRMSQFYSNLWQGLSKDAEGAAAVVNIQNLFRRMLMHLASKTHMDQGIAAQEPVDSYWKQVRYLLVQLWGMRDGYNAHATQNGVRQLDLLDLMIINSHAIIPEMMEAFTPQAAARRHAFQSRKEGASSATLLEKDFRDIRNGGDNGLSRLRGRSLQRLRPTPLFDADRDWERRVAKHGHCSALVRLAPEGRELLVGHSTWNDYSKMTRIFKYYKFSLPGSGSAVKLMAFSSYPGCVGSTDNFYMLDSGLVAVDTSLEVINLKVYDRLPDFQTSPYIPNFMHVIATSRIAHTSADWTSVFSRQGSGFPSSQWVVVDYNRFAPHSPIAVNTVRLLEQLPGIIRHDDVSEVVRKQGYWASYNRPYFEEIREASGHTAAQVSFGDLYSFENSPRAIIFRRVAGSVADLSGMRHAMRRNAYPNEDVLPSEPGHAISARMDLDALSRIPNGGIDSKVVSRCLLQKMQCQAESGPTHDSQPVFRWRDAGGGDLFPGWPHLGLPSVWNFGWVQMTPSAVLDKPVDLC